MRKIKEMIDKCPKHKCALIKTTMNGCLTLQCPQCKSDRSDKEQGNPDIGKLPYQVYQELDESRPNSEINKFRPGHYTKGHYLDLDKINEHFQRWGNGWLKIELERIIPVPEKRNHIDGDHHFTVPHHRTAIFKIYLWEKKNSDSDTVVLDSMQVSHGCPAGGNDLENAIDVTISFMIDQVFDKAYSHLKSK